MDAGIYDDLSNADYFRETDWVSSSKLKAYLPEYYKPSTGPSDALDFGSAFHSRVLGGPSEPIAVVTASTWQGRAAQEQRRIAHEDGKIPVLTKDLERLDAMELAVQNHPEAAELLYTPQGTSEVSVFTEVDGIPCKARFDRLNDSCVAVDLKTTAAKPGPTSLARAVLDYGYEIQADHYMRVAAAAGLDVDTFIFVWVAKDDPWYVSVVELDEGFYDRAAHLRDLALERMQHPEMVEAYPGAESRLVAQLPRWARLG